jgi:membrane protein
VVILFLVDEPKHPNRAAKPAPGTPEPPAGKERHVPRWRYAWAILKRHFAENQLLLRVAALTYATLLSSVPFLAVVVSLLRAFGVEQRVLPVLVERLRIGGDVPTEVILDSVARLSAGALGAAGAVGLLFAALLLLAQVDGAFNAIWGVRENRPLTTRLVGYGGLLIIGPMWIALWTSAVSSFKLAVSAWPGGLSTLGLTLARTGGPLLVLLVLTALYIVTPNTRVRFLPAFAGALIATILLELSQMLFVTSIKTSAAYEIVYGTLAALPIFLAWIYLNWLMVMLGAEAAYLVQNVPTWLQESEEPESLSWDERERMALASSALLAADEKPIPVDRLAKQLSVSPRLVHRPLDDLEDSGWIVPVRDDRGQATAYIARAELRHKTLAEVRRTLRALGVVSALGGRPPAFRVKPSWMTVLEPLERDSDRPFETVTTLELAELLTKKADQS